MNDVEDDECKHGIYPPSSCTICSGKDKPVRNEAVIVVEARFHAKYEGKCYRCGDTIEVGDMMARDVEDRYFCESCTT